MRGNVVDLAVGVIMGVAFGKIVTFAVNDILMPPIGLALGKVDFANFFVNLSDKPTPATATVAAAKAAGIPTLNYGIFLNDVLDFLIVAFVIFLNVKQINRFQAPVEAPPPAPAKEEQLLTEIRNLLAARR